MKLTTVKTKLMYISMLLASLAAFSFYFYHLQKRKNIRQNSRISLITFQTSIGWGYDVKVKDKTLIHQPFIPVIETHTGFKTKEIAEKVGNIVIEKLLKNQRPTLTMEDLNGAGIAIDYNLIKSGSKIKD